MNLVPVGMAQAEYDIAVAGQFLRQKRIDVHETGFEDFDQPSTVEIPGRRSILKYGLLSSQPAPFYVLISVSYEEMDWKVDSRGI